MNQSLTRGPRTPFLAFCAFGSLLAACSTAVDIDAAPSDASTLETGADASRADSVVNDTPTSDTLSGDTSVVDAAASDVAIADASTDAPAMATHTCPDTLPRFDLRADFHAVGDGMADDTDALHDASVALERAGGGELVIPPGTYRIGRQGAAPSYPSAPMFAVDGASCLQVSGYGAALRLTAGLRYGSFPTSTGSASVAIGHMVEVTNSSNVLIEGLEIDGNNTELVLGGSVGDVDRQGQATGVWLNRDTDVHVRDIHTHHHGLDGITVLYRGAAPPRRMPHLLERVNSEYNGRQGISWIGGWGLEAVDCQFNHTGRAINHGGGADDGMPLMSRPTAGLDIEPNAGTAEQSRDGQFTRCEFVDNGRAGLTAAVGDGGYSTFTDCTFWGTTSQSAWVNRPGLRFVDSRFYGTVVHASDGRATSGDAPVASLATVFEGCTFEDRPWTDGNVYRSGNLVVLNMGEGEGVTWRNCTFINHEVRGVYDADTNTHEIFDTCTFQFDNNSLTALSYQTYFSGSRITSTHFTETPRITRDYTIRGSANVVIGRPAPGAPDTVVDGPHVTWGGSTGVIPPT